MQAAAQQHRARKQARQHDTSPRNAYANASTHSPRSRADGGRPASTPRRPAQAPPAHSSLRGPAAEQQSPRGSGAEAKPTRRHRSRTTRRGGCRRPRRGRHASLGAGMAGPSPRRGLCAARPRKGSLPLGRHGRRRHPGKPAHMGQSLLSGGASSCSCHHASAWRPPQRIGRDPNVAWRCSELLPKQEHHRFLQHPPRRTRSRRQPRPPGPAHAPDREHWQLGRQNPRNPNRRTKGRRHPAEPWEPR
mmetsp:Transcript_105041/g.266836  ORF Transcript_105041/g.266836 Transcript_105041/m.266836 type:complete len:247 (-) Transcript_105041:22-762(-)